MKIYLNAISHHFASTKVSNEEIIADYNKYAPEPKELTAEDLFRQCGVRNRYRCLADETARNLGTEASKKMAEEWNVDLQIIDYVIFISDGLEHKGPTTACLIQNDLGLRNDIGALDVLHGCTGFIYGLNLAKALILAETAKHVLVITADNPTKVVHPEDADIRAIFSDAAAASLISSEPIEGGMQAEINRFDFGVDGKGSANLFVERSAMRNPPDIEWLSQYTDVPGGMGAGRLRMNSPQIFLFAIRNVPALINNVLEKHGMEKEEIDFFILHQANVRILEFLGKKMKIPPHKLIIRMEDIGNTVSASIPIAMNVWQQKSPIPKGSKVLVAGFGIGYSWGGTILTF